MPLGRTFFIASGAILVSLLAVFVGQEDGPKFAERLAADTQRVIRESGGTGIKARFVTANGWATRHPTLSGGKNLDEGVRARTARAISEIPGVGGVHWSDSTAKFVGIDEVPKPLHCQDDVEALLRARTIRFEESSAAIDPASRELIDEVARALRPCLGSIIAITGHTDSSGTKPGNLALSRERAQAVQQALVRRGIPADGLRAGGVGSKNPIEGLDPADPANRRIEFSIVEQVPIRPTAIDTPGPR